MIKSNSFVVCLCLTLLNQSGQYQLFVQEMSLPRSGSDNRPNTSTSSKLDEKVRVFVYKPNCKLTMTESACPFFTFHCSIYCWFLRLKANTGQVKLLLLSLFFYLVLSSHKLRITLSNFFLQSSFVVQDTH